MKSKYLNGQAWLSEDGVPFDAAEIAVVAGKCAKRDGNLETFDKVAQEFFVRPIPSKESCTEFLRGCRIMLNGGEENKDQGVWSNKALYERFGGHADFVDSMVEGCLLWRLSERQGGGLVI